MFSCSYRAGRAARTPDRRPLGRHARSRTAIAPRAARLRSASCPLTEAEDDELGRLHRRKADVDKELAAVTHVCWVELLVALDEERLRRVEPKERALAPGPREERRDV